MKTKLVQEVIENKQVTLGNGDYEYIKKNNGKEILCKVENTGKQEIQVILKDVSQGNSTDIENYIIDVLSDLYIQRNIQTLI